MSESPAAARSVLYRVCHETLYHYANPVTNARQLAHLQQRLKKVPEPMFKHYPFKNKNLKIVHFQNMIH